MAFVTPENVQIALHACKVGLARAGVPLTGAMMLALIAEMSREVALHMGPEGWSEVAPVLLRAMGVGSRRRPRKTAPSRPAARPRPVLGELQAAF